MEGRRIGGLMAALVAATILLNGSMVAAATSHVVGGSTGWTIPPNSTFYSDWASSQTIAAGDTLVFDFQTGTHDVIEVTKSSYDSCSTTSSIGAVLKNGPATVTVTAGKHYYICGVTGHCSAGQKLAITVSASKSTASPAPSPTAGNPAPTVPKVASPTANSPAPTTSKAASPTSNNPAPTPKVASPTANGPAPSSSTTPPTTGGLAPITPPASPPGGLTPTMPTTANPPTALGPSGSGSSPTLRTAATMVVLLAVATATFLL